MEFVWCLISPNFKVWELCGKKGWWLPSVWKTYGYAMPAHFPHQLCLTFLWNWCDMLKVHCPIDLIVINLSPLNSNQHLNQLHLSQVLLKWAVVRGFKRVTNVFFNILRSSPKPENSASELILFQMMKFSWWG